ncbi:hypothetical protein Val02_62770 [Virgisporangium aliadipatigenens]|uniref:Uncharacterized protein n=1 Tax=Virgisporangium aliadipatigenens TaxID=741659 RepID=A0A8J4DTK4_9ACTN|nr:hypothetical protein [Virgisporangium aliadipatigenens]GIJ49391.1 hypothetical protein Val02_62770 [Virgisporangium aliadipatigenens]
MPNPSGTPLSRFGRRVADLLPLPTRTPVSQTASDVGTTDSRDVPVVDIITPTIRTMVIAVPDEVPSDALACGHLDRHLAVTGRLTPRFWATPALHRWQHRRMFGLRQGRPTYCAGGPVRLLDLAGMRHSAAVSAGLRHQRWHHITRGTRAATPWPQFLHRHHTDPHRYPLHVARADFERQPRVLAMRMHNAVSPPAGQLDIDELEVLQTSAHAYRQYRAASAVTADAVLTDDGTSIAPNSDTFADRVTYLHRAVDYLDSLHGTQRLLAINL